MSKKKHGAPISVRLLNKRFMLGVMALLVSACTVAGTPERSFYDFDEKAARSLKAKITRESDRDVLVVIRYPATVEPEAEALYRNLYDNRGFTNLFFHAPAGNVQVPWVGHDVQGFLPKDMDNAHWEALTKTVYLAIDFYLFLKDLMPPDTVRLQPVRMVQRAAERTGDGIAWGETAPLMLVEEPSQSYPPAVIYVDLFAHVHPYWRAEEGTTFGKTIVPLITIRTAPRAAPKTYGGIAVTDAFLPYVRVPTGTNGAENGFGATFVDYLNGTAGVPPSHIDLPEERLSHEPSVSLDRYVIAPLGNLALDETVMREQAGQKEITATPAASIYKTYYRLIQEALAIIPYNDATRDVRIDYVSWFDPVLGSSMRSGASLSTRDRAKLAILREFERAEWNFIGKKDAVLIDNSFFGPWGAFMRDQRVAEEAFRERYNRAKAQAQASLHASAWMGGLSAMAANPTGGLGLAMGAVQLAQEGAREQTAVNKQLAGLSRTFRQHLENTVDKELSFLLDIGGESIEVRSRSLEELRFKMKRTYERKFGGQRSSSR